MMIKSDSSLYVYIMFQSLILNTHSYNISGTLRNLTEDDNSNRLYIAAQEGLEYLIKVGLVLVKRALFCLSVGIEP